MKSKGLRVSQNALVYEDKWYNSQRALYRSFENPTVTYAMFLRRISKGMDPREAATQPRKQGRVAGSSTLRNVYNSFENPAVTYDTFMYRVWAKGWDYELAATKPGTRGRKKS